MAYPNAQNAAARLRRTRSSDGAVDHLGKQCGKFDGERIPCTLRLPLEKFPGDLRPGVARPPPLDEPSIDIHDPVLRHARPLITPALDLPVRPRARRREYLDHEEQS